MLSLLFLLFISQSETPFQKYVVQASEGECILVQDEEHSVDAGDLVLFALSRDCATLRISEGEWVLSRTLQIDRMQDIAIRGESKSSPPVLKGNISLSRVDHATFENLVIAGTLELDQTSDLNIRDILFQRGGIWMKGKRCNQPNECVAYNRNIRIEDCTFENSTRGIFAERLEGATIINNRFVGRPATILCGRGDSVGIEIDGSSEDLDRPLEYGHNKGNQILMNLFEQENATGIRIKGSYANTIRENRFYGVFRALEFFEDARYSQIHSNYIGYLTQQVSTSACPGPCGIYTGPGSVNNIFINNFFEQNFELQFLDNNRNRAFVIDESGNLNVFRSDFQPIRQ